MAEIQKPGPVIDFESGDQGPHLAVLHLGGVAVFDFGQLRIRDRFDLEFLALSQKWLVHFFLEILHSSEFHPRIQTIKQFVAIGKVIHRRPFVIAFKAIVVLFNDTSIVFLLVAVASLVLDSVKGHLKTMKNINQKYIAEQTTEHITDQEQRVIDLAMDYSERVRSYGVSTNLVKIDDYLVRLPKECHASFLELVNLDALADTVESIPPLPPPLARREHAGRAPRPS